MDDADPDTDTLDHADRAIRATATEGLADGGRAGEATALATVRPPPT